MLCQPVVQDILFYILDKFRSLESADASVI